MIHLEQIDEVKKISMARYVFGLGAYFSACYWVDNLLIDTGCARTVNQLIPALKDLPIELVVNTHSHEDHIGGNAMLMKLYGIRPLAHPLALPIMANPRKKMRLYPHQRIMMGYPEPSKGRPIGETLTTSNHVFMIIHTPGHCRDHICLYEPTKKWLFCGDVYIGGRDKALRYEYNIYEIIASLIKISNLDIDCLFTGSGSVYKNPKNKLMRKIDYLEGTGEKVQALNRQGLNYRQISRRLFGRESRYTYISFGNFSGKNLVRSYIVNNPPGSKTIK